MAVAFVLLRHVQAEVRRWFEAVRYHVLADAFAPDGPVVGLQVGKRALLRCAARCMGTRLQRLSVERLPKLAAESVRHPEGL